MPQPTLSFFFTAKFFPKGCSCRPSFHSPYSFSCPGKSREKSSTRFSLHILMDATSLAIDKNSSYIPHCFKKLAVVQLKYIAEPRRKKRRVLSVPKNH